MKVFFSVVREEEGERKGECVLVSFLFRLLRGESDSLEVFERTRRDLLTNASNEVRPEYPVALQDATSVLCIDGKRKLPH